MPVSADRRSPVSSDGTRAPRRRIAVIGAGAAGLVTARTLLDAGHRVVVFERDSDVGGVWSPTRSYQGLTTQNDKRSYTFSDAPPPEDWPEHPAGQQMHAYLLDYARRHGVLPLVRFGCSVRRVSEAEGGFALLIDAPEGGATEAFDAVVVANGIFSTPRPLPWAGQEAFEAAGGAVVPIAGTDRIGHEDVVVVGWGKTACDLAVALADRASSVTLVARRLQWKVPDRIGEDRLHERLMETRAGEYLLFGGQTGLGRWVRLSTLLARRAALARIGRRIVRAHGLDRLGLLPEGRVSEANSKVTEGLYEAVAAGRVRVRRGVGVAALEGGAQPVVRLTDGSALVADAIVPAIGYRSELDLLDPAVLRRAVDGLGRLRLEQRIHVAGAGGLYLVGWTQGPCVPGLLSAEISAAWTALHLERAVGREPAPDGEIEALPVTGGAIDVPVEALADLDARLRDMGAPLPRAVRLEQWRRPVRADQYRGVLDAVRERLRLSEPTPR